MRKGSKNLFFRTKSYVRKNGLRVNSDGTDIRDRKKHLKICSNHRRSVKTFLRRWNSGTAIRDGNGWYKSAG